MITAEELWSFYVVGQIAEINEQRLAHLAEQVLDELDLNCAVLDLFRVTDETGVWCIDLTGNWGQVCVDLRGSTTETSIKEEIRARFQRRATQASHKDLA